MGNIDGLTLMQREDPSFAEHYLRWESIRQTSASHQVAICGLMNAGKSALLNMLTGHLEQESLRHRRESHHGRRTVNDHGKH